MNQPNPESTPKWTAQQIFDHVLAHLRKQGRAAANDHGRCLYRATDGSMCAVGCLIPDDLYDSVIEEYLVGSSFDSVIDDPVSAAEGEMVLVQTLEGLGLSGHSCLLDELQEAHDLTLKNEGLVAWELSMQRIAGQFDLTYTPPQGDQQ